jgi:hypothetical protein
VLETPSPHGGEGWGEGDSALATPLTLALSLARERGLRGL